MRVLLPKNIKPLLQLHFYVCEGSFSLMFLNSVGLFGSYALFMFCTLFQWTLGSGILIGQLLACGRGMYSLISYTLLWQVKIHQTETKTAVIMFLHKIIRCESTQTLKSYPRSQSQEQLSFLICIQKLRYDFRHGADELLDHAVVLHAAPLDDLPHGRRHQAKWWYEEAKRRQQKRRIWNISYTLKIPTWIITEAHFETCSRFSQTDDLWTFHQNPRI